MNIFKLPANIMNEEIFEALIPDNGVLIERIISNGQSSPEGYWYEQDRDEWVMVLQGEAKLSWDDGRELYMQKGEWVLIPAMQKHRVEWTSSEPPCIWLAVHGNLCAKENKR